MATNLTDRQQCLGFARLHGLQAKGERLRRVGGTIITVFNPKTSWVDCFDTWAELLAFFQAARDARQFRDEPFPWDRKAA